MADFFISYNSDDRAWAEWIAYLLESNGYKTRIQAWDFRPGNNFVVEMQRASKECARTLLVLSSSFLTSGYTESEWAAAFRQDPQGLKRKLLPVMVKFCEPDGLLGSIVQIRINGLDEKQAAAEVLEGIKEGRVFPSAPPIFPGNPVALPPKEFPGPSESPPQPQNQPKPPDGERAPPSQSPAHTRWTLSQVTMRVLAPTAIAVTLAGSLWLYRQNTPPVVDVTKDAGSSQSGTTIVPPHSTVSYTICHGEDRSLCDRNPYQIFEHCGNDNGVGGADPKISATTLCPGRPFTLRSTQGGSIGGDHCGYSWFAIDCH